MGREVAASPSGGEAVGVLLGRACDNRCVFCAQDGLPDAPADVGAALRAARSRSDSVFFIGGEPTLAHGLETALAASRALGFRVIGLQTNGAALDLVRARALRALGLTDVHLSIHGAEARVHDYHTGSRGSFDRVTGALRAAHAAELRIGVTTVVTRSNARVLGAIPGLLAARHVSAWTLSFARHAGRAAAASDRVVPRFGIAAPYALHAIERAEALGLPCLLAGAPACALGPYASRALPEPARAFGEPCAACDARATCAGVDAWYLARFGGDELAPVARVARDGDVAALAPRFPGVGDLASPAEAVARAAPSRSLPMLGRVKPARGEAAAGAERKSGEALREIFPDLLGAPRGK